MRLVDPKPKSRDTPRRRKQLNDYPELIMAHIDVEQESSWAATLGRNGDPIGDAFAPQHEAEDAAHGVVKAWRGHLNKRGKQSDIFGDSAEDMAGALPTIPEEQEFVGVPELPSA